MGTKVALHRLISGCYSVSKGALLGHCSYAWRVSRIQLVLVFCCLLCMQWLQKKKKVSLSWAFSISNKMQSCYSSTMWRSLGIEQKELPELVKNVKLGQEKLKQNYPSFELLAPGLRHRHCNWHQIYFVF